MVVRYGMINRDDVHGAGQRIVTMDKPYGEAMGLGKQIAEGMTGEEILTATDTNWDVEAQPVFLANGSPVEGVRAIVRMDTGESFGSGRAVSAQYPVYHNRELIQFAQDLTRTAEDGGTELLFEAGGYLKGGQVVWYQARLPGLAVSIRDTRFGPDRVDPYIFLLTSHDGSSSTIAHLSANRFFCNNQIASALRAGKLMNNRVSVRHSSKMRARLADARKVLEVALGFYEEHVAEMRELDATSMTANEMRNFAEKLIGETQESIVKAERTIAEATHNRRVAQIERITSLFSTGLGNIGRSRFDALQAVTEFADHHRPTASQEARLRRLTAPVDQEIKTQALRLLLP